MSKMLKLVAAATLLAGTIAVTPAQAQHRHHGWHHHGWNHHGWAPGFALGFGLGTGWGPYYGGPYYAAEPACGWVSKRVRVRGHLRWRQVWRCW